MSTETETAPPPLSTTMWEEREVDGKKVRVITRAFHSKEHAREVFLYRPVDAGIRESRWGGGLSAYDITLLLGGTATRCKMCHAITRNRHLENNTCPDCDGRAEIKGYSPYIPETRSR